MPALVAKYRHAMSSQAMEPADAQALIDAGQAMRRAGQTYGHASKAHIKRALELARRAK